MEKPESTAHVERSDSKTIHVSPDHTRGHAIQHQEHNRTYLQTLRRDPWLLLWIGVMLWTLIVRGFENQSSGSVISIPVFKERFGKQLDDGSYFIETSWQSALSGGSNGAAIFGAWASSYFADLIGFKPVILIAAAINIGSVGVEFASTSIEMFFAGKMVNFVAIGAFQNLCTAYVADVSPLAIRSTTIGFCNLAQCIGPFISAILSNFSSQWETNWSWQSLIVAQWGFAGVALIGQLLMPESPVYLTLAISISISSAVNTTWSFVAPYMFNPGYGNLKAKIGFVYGAFMVIFAVLAFLFVPETRMRSYEELDELFMNKVPTRQFRTYVTLAERRAEEAYAIENGLKGTGKEV
ncbi:hypothetical protein H9Q69_013276 [Fusarium xylarioides]|nr:hypothetical protein H9Q69_013276 [Fusarium xylarioides]